MEFVFWVAAALVVYSYLIYPVLIFFLSKLIQRKTPVVSDFENIQWPEVAIIIAAYNEEIDITERLDNLNDLQYPSDKLYIYIGSDGSTDKTNTLIQNHRLKNLKFFPFQERRGKASVLNDLCEEAKEEILIFSDANTLFESNVVKKLVKPFSDPLIGGVCGELEIHASSHSSNQDGFYWKYEKFLKINENKINGLLGANGAIYAIRKQLFMPLLPDTIIDDFMVAMRVVLQGNKMIYEPEAIAHEYAPETIEHEFKRRVRIGTGNYQAFFRLLKFLNPATSTTHFFTYISHKVLRWFAPHLLLLCLITSIILVKNPVFMILLVIQLSVYIFSAFSMIFSFTDKMPKIISIIIFFVSMNIALLVGFFKYLSSNVNPAWERTSR